MSAEDKKRIILAAGGTGGHIWPALSFGHWISERHPECEVKYVCGSRPLEREIYAAGGVEPFVMPLAGSPLAGKGMREKGKRSADVCRSYGIAKKTMEDFRPDAALLFGGYISLPFIAACKKLHVRCVMHEQNARAGKATRFAAALGIDVCSGWNDCLPLSPKKYLRTGVPVRDFVLPKAEEAWKKLSLEGKLPKWPRVVAFTGSLGSRTVKERICEIAGEREFKNWTFILPAVSQSVEKHGDNIWMLPRIWDASLLYAIADMLVLRAGGSTLTEAGVLGIPALIIPWKDAADNHQYHNALSFVSENAGLILDREDDRDHLSTSLLRVKAMCGGEKKQSLYGQGRLICENLWSAIWND